MRHPVQGMYGRHISGADDFDYQLNRDWWNAEVHRYGVEAGRRDALAKQPSDWVRAYKAFAASDEFMHGALHPDEGVPVTSDLEDWLPKWFQKGYEQGYAEGADAMEAAKPGAKGELGLINLAESLKIDRETHPAEFAKWEKQQAAKMTGLNAASIEAATELGLAVLIGLARARDPFKDAASGSSVGATEPMSTTSKVVLGLAAVGVGAVLIKSAFSLQAALEPGPLRQGACQVEAPGEGDSYSKSSYGAANILRNRDDVGAVVFEVNGEGWYVSDLLDNSGPMSKAEALRRANQEVAWGRFRDWGGLRNRIACAQPDGSFVSLPAKV